MTDSELLHRGRQLRRVVAREGVRGAALRVARRIERRLAVGGSSIGLHLSDVADSSSLPPAAPPPSVADRPLTIGWITAPPSAGSGGHTTMFRMIEGLEQAGHRCSLHLYDVYDGDVRARGKVVRQYWPQVRASVADVRDGLPVLDAWVATSWETAHVLARRPAAGGHRFYFVQDYEPHFYPRGAEYLLAEDTYRFGFHGITAGRWLADLLETRFGMPCTAFEFGADRDVYQADPAARRNGVVFYAKPDVARRGFTLGVLALTSFAEANPGVPIHLFGDDPGRLPFPAVSHGRVRPAELNRLYNSCRVGLSLSMTNVSLIPWELLSSGVVPVVNEAEHNRRVLDNPHVRWAPPSPHALGTVLDLAHRSAADPTVPVAAAKSVRTADWGAASGVVKRCIERVARGDFQGSTESWRGSQTPDVTNLCGLRQASPPA